MAKVILVLSIFFICSFASYSATQDVSLVVDVEGHFPGQMKAQAEYKARGMAVQKAFEHLPSVVLGDESFKADGEGGVDYSLEVRSVMATVANVDVLESSWAGDYLRMKAKVSLDYDRTLRMLSGISTSVDIQRQLKRTHDRYLKMLEQVNAPSRSSVEPVRSSVGMSGEKYTGLLPSQIKQEKLRQELKAKIENSLDRRYRVELPALQAVQIEVKSVQAEHIDFLISSPGFVGGDAPCVRSPQIVSVFKDGNPGGGRGLRGYFHEDELALLGVRLPLRVRLFSVYDSREMTFRSKDVLRYAMWRNERHYLPALYPTKLREMFYNSGLGAFYGSVDARFRPSSYMFESDSDSLALMWAGSVSLDVYARLPELLLELFVADFQCPYR